MDTQQKKLEELIQRELSKLPERAAPASLIPNVLAKIQARQARHWWQRPWGEWPFGARVLSLPLMLASACGTLMAVSVVYKLLLAAIGIGQITERFSSVSAFWDVITALGNAVLVLGRSSSQQWLLMGFAVALAMYLACVGLGTLCFRMALHSRSSRHE